MLGMETTDRTDPNIRVEMLESGPTVTLSQITAWMERVLGRALTEGELARAKGKLGERFPPRGAASVHKCTE